MKFFIFMLITLPVSSFGHGGEEGNLAIGKGKGVESYDEHDGFVLAPPAIKRLEIVTGPAETARNCKLKTAQIIATLAKKSVYVLRDQKFKAIEIKCSAVKDGDQFVIKGAEYLRVIEMDLTGGEEGEHEDHQDEAGADDHDHESKKGGGSDD